MPKVDYSSGCYRGRFAPSPTGELHLGSLAAALASYLQAKHHQGLWLIRIDDIDPQREVPGSALSIISTLENFGLRADAGICYQSQRFAVYEQALQQLLRHNHAYPCACSRAALNQHGRYPGHCFEPVRWSWDGRRIAKGNCCLLTHLG